MYARHLVRLTVPALAAFAILGTPLPASAQTSTVIIAPSAPPPLRVETIPPPPASEVVSWQAGHWAWDGTTWHWDEGHYVQAPAPTAVWEPGHWAAQMSGGYVWVDGHWRS